MPGQHTIYQNLMNAAPFVAVVAIFVVAVLAVRAWTHKG